jgi:hypothetical protein
MYTNLCIGIFFFEVMKGNRIVIKKTVLSSKVLVLSKLTDE